MTQALRSKPDIADIRGAFNDRSQSWSDKPMQLSDFEQSNRLYNLRHSSAPHTSRKPLVHQIVTELPQRFFSDRSQKQSPVASVRSTTSSVDNQRDFLVSVEQQELVDQQELPVQATPTTPRDFTVLFPSSRDILIRHDDMSPDRNWNLRLDTAVGDAGTLLTLFHMRLQNLDTRGFSLRRYYRDSGREVCHSTRRSEARTGRTGLRRSLSYALDTVRARSSSSRRSLDAQLKRHDSVHDSVSSLGEGSEATSQRKVSTKTIRLEFSNYAQVDVVRKGSRFDRRYTFQYWGDEYAWKRSRGKTSDAVFRLLRNGSHEDLGHIRRLPLSQEEERDEGSEGGWFPPSSMRIEDKGILASQKDLSDVIVAAGLVAVVDDALRLRSRQTAFPRVEFVGPKRFMQELTKSARRSRSVRRPSTSSAY